MTNRRFATKLGFQLMQVGNPYWGLGMTKFETSSAATFGSQDRARLYNILHQEIIQSLAQNILRA